MEKDWSTASFFFKPGRNNHYSVTYLYGTFSFNVICQLKFILVTLMMLQAVWASLYWVSTRIIHIFLTAWAAHRPVWSQKDRQTNILTLIFSKTYVFKYLHYLCRQCVGRQYVCRQCVCRQSVCKQCFCRQCLCRQCFCRQFVFRLNVFWHCVFRYCVHKQCLCGQ